MRRSALHQHGGGDGRLARLDDLDVLAPGLVQVLAQLLRGDAGQLLDVQLDQGLPAIEHLGAHGDGLVGPGGKGPIGRVDGGSSPPRRCRRGPRRSALPWRSR